MYQMDLDAGNIKEENTMANIEKSITSICAETAVLEQKIEEIENCISSLNETLSWMNNSIQYIRSDLLNIISEYEKDI